MAEELSIEPDSFGIDVQWPSDPEAGGNPQLDASLSRFEMKVGASAITAYLTDLGTKNTYLTVPAYYLVEWLAQNWWAFLYEPKKLDRSDADSEFRSRHWFGFPRHGIALPDVMFVPSGETIEIVARQAYLRFAQLSFTEACVSTVRTTDVKAELHKFINAVLDHMKQKGVGSSEAHQAWQKVIETSAEQEEYCRLIGSMGLSPYVEHPEIDAALERVSDTISQSALVDLCEATTLGNFKRAAEFTGRIAEALRNSGSFDVTPLTRLAKPKDNVTRAYEWGYNAAAQVRNALGIAHDSPEGRKEFFKKLGFDPSQAADLGNPVSTIFPIQGAVGRAKSEFKLALSSGTDKEFSAARGSFLAWVSDDESSRLVTTSRTRQQQASRAFGAELLAPASYLEKRLGKEKDVSTFLLDKVSGEIGVASTIVRLQAQNHGYRLLEAA
ncbi:hypothetical protein ACVI1L_004712 [Bradyrhizobium sp. USDA 4516]